MIVYLMADFFDSVSIFSDYDHFQSYLVIAVVVIKARIYFYLNKYIYIYICINIYIYTKIKYMHTYEHKIEYLQKHDIFHSK